MSKEVGQLKIINDLVKVINLIIERSSKIKIKFVLKSSPML